VPLFEVKKGANRVAEIEPTTFPDLKLWERQDLEAWVLSAPELAGGDFTVLTSEFDRFDRTSERLDVLGLVQIEPGRGRLVVVELKRDGTSTTVDLQAIKYAAYVAAVQFSNVVEMYARHHGVSEENARTTLLALLGGSEEEPPSIDDTPRIVLVASDFRTEVTTTVLWLIDNFEMDIRCVRLQPFAVDKRVLVHSETIIPLPEAEQYRLGVQRKRREIERDQEQKARARRLLPQLLEAGALEIGQTLYFRREAVPSTSTPWTAKEPLYQATLITGEGNRTLEWTDPESGETTEDSPSLLASRLLHRLGQRTGELSSAGVNGMTYWTVDGEISLRDLGAEVGVLERAARRVDRDALRNACSAIPAGRWTTYGDLAEAIGVRGAAQSVAGVISSDQSVPNAHRVLRSSGQISPGWSTTDGGGPEVARQRLEEEGLNFDAAGAADSSRRWKAKESSGTSG
jgi:alkylated DNA nucleotide flippase Atl1